MKIDVKFIFDAIGAIGAFLTGLSVVFGIYKYIDSLLVKNETMFGDEAKERFKQIENQLNSKSAVVLKPLEHKGGDIIVPRLEIRKISSYSKTIGKEWKGRKAIVKYSDNEEGDKPIMFKRWLI